MKRTFKIELGRPRSVWLEAPASLRKLRNNAKACTAVSVAAQLHNGTICRGGAVPEDRPYRFVFCWPSIF
jgi:hypothetical protein